MIQKTLKRFENNIEFRNCQLKYSVGIYNYFNRK